MQNQASRKKGSCRRLIKTADIFAKPI